MAEERLEKWINNCKICQRTKSAIRRAALLERFMAGESMEWIDIDVMEPLPETERGNKFIVVIIDYFRTEAYATKGSQSRNHCKATDGGIHKEI